MVWSLLAVAGLLIGVVSAIFVVKGAHQFYWLASLGIYIFSLVMAFSIGQLTVGLTFVPLALAMGYSFNLIKTIFHFWSFLFLGILVGCLLIIYVDDVWLLFPLRFLPN